MIHNIINCIQEEKELDRQASEYLINVVISNLIIFENMMLEKRYHTNTFIKNHKYGNFLRDIISQ